MNYEIDAKNIGSYDVVVCGGGTAGCIAAIAAAREGANTLLIERSFTVGGMLTVGEAGITKFTEHCVDVDKYKTEVLDVLATDPKKVQVVRGIAHEYVTRMLREGKALGTHGEAGSYIFTDKAESQWTLMQMLEEAGVEVMYDTRVCMPMKEGDRMVGVVVHNKEGFCEIGARVVIDATGDGDVAALAGVPYGVGASERDIKEFPETTVLGQLHEFGTMFRVNGVDFERLFDYMEEDPETRFMEHRFGVMSLENARESYRKGQMSVFRVCFIYKGKPRYCQIYDLPAKDEAILLGPECAYKGNGLDARSLSKGQYKLQEGARKLLAFMKENIPGFENAKVTYIPDVGVRETRHFECEYVLSTLELLSGKDFEDSIACGGHPVDIYPRPKELDKVELNHWRFHIPYRVMLPKTVENLLITGRCVSVTRIASGAVRPTAQCMAMGEAAGIAAAMAVKENVNTKNVDIKKLRAKLVENGAII